MSDEQVNQQADQLAENIVNSPEVDQALDQVVDAVVDQVESSTVENTTVSSAPKVPITSSSAPVEYFFEGAKVVSVLETLPGGLKLCAMSDGTTKHVPAEVFN